MTSFLRRTPWRRLRLTGISGQRGPQSATVNLASLDLPALQGQRCCLIWGENYWNFNLSQVSQSWAKVPGCISVTPPPGRFTSTGEKLTRRTRRIRALCRSDPLLYQKFALCWYISSLRVSEVCRVWMGSQELKADKWGSQTFVKKSNHWDNQVTAELHDDLSVRVIKGSKEWEEEEETLDHWWECGAPTINNTDHAQAADSCF